jgi:hypothetical protein
MPKTAETVTTSGPKERKWKQNHWAESTATLKGLEHYGNNINGDASK